MLQLDPNPSSALTSHARPLTHTLRQAAKAPLVMGGLLFFSLLATAMARAELPDEGDCPTVSVQPGGPESKEDAIPVQIKEGMVLLEEDLMVLRQLVPVEIWRKREIFFHEGMRLEIGPCHRRYATAPFYRDATMKFAGQPKIDRKGNLKSYEAGTPFVQDMIDPESKHAAIQWAYNSLYRYRGAGPRGRFRLTDFPSALGSIMTLEGDFFLFQVRHRSDTPATKYEIGKGRMNFAAGGEFYKPFDARGLAWRQFRSAKSETRYSEPDDIFTYIPVMRKMRRAAQNWADGLYVPRYTLPADGSGGSVAYGAMGSVSPTSGRSIAVSEDIRKGLTGMMLRPNAYDWRLIGQKNVLAPINIAGQGYPVYNDRNFGPSGLSVADDRWDLRYAVVIEGARKVDHQDIKTLTIYLDYQTLQPLYWVTRTGRRRLLDIGILAYRFSDDSAMIQEWPGGTTAAVFEPVLSVFFDAGSGSGGWRRESFDLISTPYTPEQRRNMTTTDVLQHGH